MVLMKIFCDDDGGMGDVVRSWWWKGWEEESWVLNRRGRNELRQLCGFAQTLCFA